MVSGSHSTWDEVWEDLEGRDIKSLIEDQEGRNVLNTSKRITDQIEEILAVNDDDEALDGFEDRGCHREMQDFLKSDFTGPGRARINNRNMVQATIRLLSALDLTEEASWALDMLEEESDLDDSDFEIEEMCNELLYFYRKALNPSEVDVDDLINGYDDPGCSFSEYVIHAFAVGVRREVIQGFVTTMARS